MYRLHTNVNSDPMTEVISTRVPDGIAKDLKEIEKEEKTDRAVYPISRKSKDLQCLSD